MAWLLALSSAAKSTLLGGDIRHTSLAYLKDRILSIHVDNGENILCALCTPLYTHCVKVL